LDVLSPSARFAAGARTGKFRLGGHEFLRDAQGRSWISMEDFAIALVDSLSARSTVGSALPLALIGSVIDRYWGLEDEAATT
jgi:hypothetical protein